MTNPEGRPPASSVPALVFTALQLVRFGTALALALLVWRAAKLMLVETAAATPAAAAAPACAETFMNFRKRDRGKYAEYQDDHDELDQCKSLLHTCHAIPQIFLNCTPAVICCGPRNERETHRLALRKAACYLTLRARK